MGYIPVREPATNKLLFRFDPDRNLIEIKVRGVVTVVDLDVMRESSDKCSKSMYHDVNARTFSV